MIENICLGKTVRKCDNRWILLTFRFSSQTRIQSTSRVLACEPPNPCADAGLFVSDDLVPCFRPFESPYSRVQSVLLPFGLCRTPGASSGIEGGRKLSKNKV